MATSKRKTAKKPAKVVKKATKAKATTKKAKAKTATKVTKKVAATRTTAKKSVMLNKINKPFNGSQLKNYLAESCGLEKKQAGDVMEALKNCIAAHLNAKGVGQFVMSGLFKMVVTTKPATKARKGVNPFTGEEMMIKAKPARKVVKIRALKKLKELASSAA